MNLLLRYSLGIVFFALMAVVFIVNEVSQMDPTAYLTMSASDGDGGSAIIVLRPAAISPDIIIIDDLAHDALALTFAMNGGGTLYAGTSHHIVLADPALTPLALVAASSPAPARAPPLISFY